MPWAPLQITDRGFIRLRANYGLYMLAFVTTLWFLGVGIFSPCVSLPLAHCRYLVNACSKHHRINNDKRNDRIWYQKLQEAANNALCPRADKAVDTLFSQVQLSRRGHEPRCRASKSIIINLLHVPLAFLESELQEGDLHIHDLCSYLPATLWRMSCYPCFIDGETGNLKSVKAKIIGEVISESGPEVWIWEDSFL